MIALCLYGLDCVAFWCERPDPPYARRPIIKSNHQPTNHKQCLDCPEVDEAFWRPLVQLTVGASTCPISEPYPAIVTRVRRAKKVGRGWLRLGLVGWWMVGV